jgi:putative ABC transport system permease protein
MIDFRENLGVAIDTLRSHKVRSALTVLGIVIGVTSVISVAAIINGLNYVVTSKVEAFGPQTYFLSRIPVNGQNFGKMPQKYRIRKYITMQEADELSDDVNDARVITVFGTRAVFTGETNEARHGSETVDNFILRGMEPDFPDAIPLYQVDHGRFFNAYDEEHSRQVTVLGAAIADSLFPTEDPIGKTARLNGREFEVIGTFAHDPGMFGLPGVDQFVGIPMSTFHKEYPESKELIIAFALRSDVNPQAGLDQVITAMRRIRRVRPDAGNDFEVTSSDFLSQLWNQLTGALVILTGVISSIGLLVGGIGVMNIMLISVTERTSEIGVRKAIGARKSDIRVQFLMEATILTVAGGTIGILLSGAIALLIRTVIPSIPASLSMLWVTLGVAISVSVGLFFGYYPANRAANLDPIVCLRYE